MKGINQSLLHWIGGYRQLGKQRGVCEIKNYLCYLIENRNTGKEAQGGGTKGNRRNRVGTGKFEPKARETKKVLLGGPRDGGEEASLEGGRGEISPFGESAGRGRKTQSTKKHVNARERDGP